MQKRTPNVFPCVRQKKKKEKLIYTFSLHILETQLLYMTNKKYKKRVGLKNKRNREQSVQKYERVIVVAANDGRVNKNLKAVASC